MSCIFLMYCVKKKLDLILYVEFIFYVIVRDRINLRVIVDFVVCYNWIYIVLVYDDSDEGRYRVSLF